MHVPCLPELGWQAFVNETQASVFYACLLCQASIVKRFAVQSVCVLKAGKELVLHRVCLRWADVGWL